MNKDNNNFWKIWKVFMIICGIVLLQAIVVIAVVNHNNKKEVQTQLDEYTATMESAWSDDEYIDKMSVQETCIAFTVNSNFENLSNKEKLELMDAWLIEATGNRDDYPALNDGTYVVLSIYNRNGVEIAKSNRKGQKKIITEFEE